MISEKEIKRLDTISRLLRRHVIEMTYTAQSGHPGGSFSLAHIMAVLYFKILNYKPDDPGWLERDRVVLSKGHGAPIYYAALAEAGFFPKEELSGLRKIGRLLQGHPCKGIPGVDITTGSLGLGLSAAAGIALGARMTKREDVRVYAIMGDGELGEGQVWEAAMSAAHFKLDNLVGIVDRNRYQNDAATEEVMRLEPLYAKWEAFGWNVLRINGHDVNAICEAFGSAKNKKGAPTLILADTVKGCGASYMIDKPALHYTPPTKEQMEQTLKELGY